MVQKYFPLYAAHHRNQRSRGNPYRNVLCQAFLPVINWINSSSNKLNALLRVIDDQDVDTVNMTDLVEKAMPQILAELDPHSTYIPAQKWKR